MLYSVPYEYIKKKVDVRATYTTIEIFYNHNCISSHRRLKRHPGKLHTITEHMPKDHQKYLEWNGERFRKWAERIGSVSAPILQSMQYLPLKKWNSRPIDAALDF